MPKSFYYVKVRSKKKFFYFVLVILSLVKYENFICHMSKYVGNGKKCVSLTHRSTTSVIKTLKLRLEVIKWGLGISGKHIPVTYYIT